MSISPFFITSTLRYHLSKTSSSEPVNDLLRKKIYADDFIAGADTVDEADQIMRDAQSILLEADFPLCKLATNSSELEPLIPEQCTREPHLIWRTTQQITRISLGQEEWLVHLCGPSITGFLFHYKLFFHSWQNGFNETITCRLLKNFWPTWLHLSLYCTSKNSSQRVMEEESKMEPATAWRYCSSMEKKFKDLPSLSSVTLPRSFSPGSSSRTRILCRKWKGIWTHSISPFNGSRWLSKCPVCFQQG